MAAGPLLEHLLEPTERNQDATIYVGGLHEKASEALLLDLFSDYGSIVNVHMPKDRISKRHQGYGFVEYMHVEEADSAIRVMNLVKVFGKPIRVNKAFVQYKQMDIGANVFIGNLDPEVDEKLLYDTFNIFGVMLQSPRCMRYPDTGLSKGFAFIHYASFEAADSAIETMNGRSLCNRAISLSYAFKKGSKGERHGCATERFRAARNPLPQIQMLQSPTRTLMSPLNMNVLQPAQQVTHPGMHLLPMYSLTQPSLPQYSNEPSYLVWPYQNRMVNTETAQTYSQYPYEAVIFVGGLPEKTGESYLKELFSVHGRICNVHLPMDFITKCHKGYGFIEYAMRKDADKAVESSNLWPVKGKIITVEKAGVVYESSDIGANLFIGNLDPVINEYELYQKFSDFGVMLKPPTCVRNPLTGLPKGFAFIHYSTFEAADAAIKAMSGELLGRRRISLSYAFKQKGSKERHGCPADRAAAEQKVNPKPSTPPTPPTPISLPIPANVNQATQTPSPLKPVEIKKEIFLRPIMTDSSTSPIVLMPITRERATSMTGFDWEIVNAINAEDSPIYDDFKPIIVNYPGMMNVSPVYSVPPQNFSPKAVETCYGCGWCRNGYAVSQYNPYVQQSCIQMSSPPFCSSAEMDYGCVNNDYK
uniref:Splicing factor 3B subunit 4 n=1 Tax=Strigamia maritima TaxID=126957 RepID=T1IJJ2_STRMM